MKPKDKKNRSNTPAVSKDNRNKRRSRWILIGLIILITAIAFSNSVKNGFVNWDDDLYVFTNPDIRHFDGAAIHEFFTGYFGKMYAPVTMISYALDYKIGELDATVYHRTNLILHLLNVSLVFILLYLLTGQTAIAVISALFFGLHPLHVESVAWISERKDLLYSFFYLSGLITYVRFREEKKKRKYYIFTILLFLLSLLSKSSAVTFPLILLLIDFYKGEKITLKNNLNKIPFFLMAIAFGILSLLSQKVIGANVDYVHGYTILERALLGAYAFSFYLFKSVFPFGLSALHPMPMKPGGILPLQYYFSMAVPIGFLWLLFKVFRSKINETLRKDLLFGLLFFLLTITLILLIPVGQSVVAERYAYIPYIGIFMILGRLYLYFKEKTSLNFPVLAHGFTILVVLAMIFSAGMTYSRNKVWRDSISLFSDVISKNPDAGLAYNNRGNIRMEQKDFNGAMEDFNRAIELKYEDAYYNRGVLRIRLQDYQKAVDDFNSAALLAQFDKSKVYYNRGIAKMNLSDYRGAEADFGNAIELNPQFSSAFSNRGLIRYEIFSNIEGAIKDFDQAIKIDPADPYSFYNRGNAKIKSDDFAGALSDYDQALQRAPQFAAAYFNKGVVFLKLHDLNNACRNWEKASESGATNAADLIKAYCR